MPSAPVVIAASWQGDAPALSVMATLALASAAPVAAVPVTAAAARTGLSPVEPLLVLSLPPPPQAASASSAAPLSATPNV